MAVWHSLSKRFDRKLFIFIVCAILPFAFLPLALSEYQETKCSYVILLVACYWLLEPVSIAVTSLLPVVLFPALGIISSSDVCSSYMKEAFMMIIGSLIMAVALEECRLHERIALKILMWVGSDIKWVMMGFMLTTMFLSMWVSNTATTALMVPIVDAILEKLQPLKQTSMHLERLKVDCTSDSSLKERKQNDDVEDMADDKEGHSEENSQLKVTLLLSVCYSANIGGTGTLTGTAPNLVLKGLMDVL